LLQRAAQALQSGDLLAAERACRNALKAAPNHPGGLHLLGLTARRAGHLDAALDLFRKAVNAAPRYPEAWSNMGRLLTDTGKLAEARGAFVKALEARPGYLPAELGLAHAVKLQGNSDAACTMLEEAAARHPDAAAPLADLGNLRQEQGDFAAAVAAYSESLARAPAQNPVLSNRAAALLKLKEAERALADAEAYLSTGQRSANIVAYRVLALQMLGRHAEAKAWSDPETMVYPHRPNAPQGFAAALEADVRTHPTLTEQWDPQRRAARGGAVTAELMSHPTPAIESFVRLIRAGVDNLIATLPDDAEHPFFGAKPKSYSLTVWGNILAPGGHQASHIHNLGWLSGVYYPSLPDAITDAGHQGWIAFGVPGYGLPSPPGLEPVLRKPEAGMMFFFPSYMWHHTVPLETGAERISIAFDVMPA
jgi:tetratricopeptide (TPR) repeat protein